MELRFTQSARKHRIGRGHVAFVLRTYEPVATETKRGDAALVWIGSDETGRELEIVGVEVGGYLLIIHVFPTALRRKP